MVPVLLSLPLLLGPAVLQETGPYSLVFLYTGLSRPSKGIPRFQATAFLNDQAFFHYNSNSGKVEPVGPWSQIEGMEDWEKESQLQKAREEIFLVTLKDIMDYYKDSAGSHTFQGMFGCELLNNRSSGAFWRYAYDGQDFIEFNKEIPAWIPLDPAAVNTKQKWEAEKAYTQRAKAYLEEECPTMLKRYLNYSRSHLDQKDPPTVTITSHTAPGRNRIFKCLAYDFYPQGISLHWNQAGKMLTSKSGGVFPNGNGTYLSWVEVEVPAQDRDPYFCHIEHSGLSQSLSVQWDETRKAKAESNMATQPQ
ncbi:zinc-alpha-2-glycoprotein [Cricetulus griseus]|uniref:Alpha-2-glycoprotein 1, zinc n=1 Tax=Cricetulus griseus TaxID=10029 RepID=G3I5E5_CRIGR|nr:zinc-alpha-2-glycoprotein [Cricetulus griseus]XP_027271018.1 zinc-alpha-2-glycoprotein [Cricetulus griseus]EGW05032.1 Zinc-alpha-2-glycoprotein [Cricetulus griseus]